MTTLLIDPHQKKVGCVLLQALYGGDQGALYRLGFSVDQWFYQPTADMCMVSGTDEEWERFRGLGER